jgi:hypothetical protein
MPPPAGGDGDGFCFRDCIDKVSAMVGKIFLNYRRGDDPGNTGRLFDRLQDEFEPDQLFLDVTALTPCVELKASFNYKPPTECAPRAPVRPC